MSVSYSCQISEDYIKALQLLDEYYASDDEPKIPNDVSEIFDDYGLTYDCHGFRGVYSYALSAVRGTMAAVDCLIKSQCQVIFLSRSVHFLHRRKPDCQLVTFEESSTFTCLYLLSLSFLGMSKRIQA